jgi:outer membrane biosynthesis protein TonB
MKNPTGSVKPKRLAAPKPRKRVRLDLKRRPVPQPEEDLGHEKKSNFWKWVVFVALLHLLVIAIVCLIYQNTATPKPPEQFISLLPEGTTVKGTPGAQQAHKLGATTAAPSVHHHHTSTPPPTSALPPKPVIPKPLVTPPVLEPPKPDSLAMDKPVVKPPPPKPKPPKVKVDLTLADAPSTDTVKPKPKHHLKKPIVKPTEDTEDQATDDTPDSTSTGLSKEQIAQKLGEKLDEAGIKNATNTGTSGSADSHANAYADFYAAIHDQVMDLWQSPDVVDANALNPIVHIYVEKDGRVPPESVHLTQSSGNQAYDDSAVAAAKSLGYLHEPLPDGCPPDISITFKPNR